MDPLPHGTDDEGPGRNPEAGPGPQKGRYTNRAEPRPSPLQKAAKFVYDAFYDPWIPNGRGGLSHRKKPRWLPFNYLFYAMMRWGLLEGITRYWKYEISPHNWAEWAHGVRRRWKLVDRREKKGWSLQVYAIDRDGDLYLVECPKCHQTQHLLFNLDLDQPWEQRHSDAPKVWTDAVPPKTFQCCTCSIGFRVHLEDGIRQIQDHREGTPPLPSVVVWDDNHKMHLGITADAPWWWKRREICRDLHGGKDAHGHKRYEVFPLKETPNMSEACANEACDKEQP